MACLFSMKADIASARSSEARWAEFQRATLGSAVGERSVAATVSRWRDEKNHFPFFGSKQHQLPNQTTKFLRRFLGVAPAELRSRARISLQAKHLTNQLKKKKIWLLVPAPSPLQWCDPQHNSAHAGRSAGKSQTSNDQGKSTQHRIKANSSQGKTKSSKKQRNMKPNKPLSPARPAAS